MILKRKFRLWERPLVSNLHIFFSQILLYINGVYT